MADPLISLDTERTSAQPGGQARVTVTVTNPGTLVEGYQLQVLGPLAPWAEVVPPEVSVYPQQETTAAVVISPPTGTGVPSGVQPFGVIARSTLDPNASAVAEGDIDIGEVYGVQAKIIPVTSSGRWRGRHVIQLSNWGNAPAQLRMAANDPDTALGFYVSPEYVNLPPGGTATVRLSARTRHPVLRGTPTRLPFQVVGERVDAAAGPPPAAGMGYGDPSRPVIDAAFNQKPILSKGVIALFALILAGIIALIAYLIMRGPVADEPLAPRGAPPKPTLTADDGGTRQRCAHLGTDRPSAAVQPAARRSQDRQRDRRRAAAWGCQLLHREQAHSRYRRLLPAQRDRERIDRPRLGEGVCQDRATRPIAKPHTIAYSAGKSDTAGKLLGRAFDTVRRCDPR